MTRHVIGVAILVLIAGVGCAARTAERAPKLAAPGYQLIDPPDVPDARYPGGAHVQANAPLSSWHRVAVFADEKACDSARVARIDTSIDEARAQVGERAKYQMPVRRAVNARCIPVR